MSKRRARQLRHIQRRLEHYYSLEHGPDVARFVKDGQAGSRESLFVREADGWLELSLMLPPESLDSAAAPPNDLWLQVVEGVSHFLYIAERARVGLPVTQLELELQAEVDKFVASGLEAGLDGGAELHRRLFQGVRFLHPEGTEVGERYRLAHELAARYTARTASASGLLAARERFRRFYRAGQAEKIRLARAA